MSSFADRLKNDAKAKLEGLRFTPEDKARAVALSVEYAELQARSLAGENVTAELRHVEAQAANVAAAEGMTASHVLREIAIGALSMALSRAIG